MISIGTQNRNGFEFENSPGFEDGESLEKVSVDLGRAGPPVLVTIAIRAGYEWGSNSSSRPCLESMPCWRNCVSDLITVTPVKPKM